MSDDIVGLKITLDKSDVEVKTKDIEKNLGDAGDKAGKSFTAGFKGALAAIGGAIAGIITVREAIKGAMQQETAVNALNSALVASGRYSEEASKSMQTFASSLQGASVFGDEVILKQMSLLQTMKNLDTQGLQKATKSAADLASAYGIDLSTATRAVGMALNGNAGGLGRLGIKLDEATLKSKDYNDILEKIEARVGGASARALNTFDGALTQSKNAFSDILEEAGNLIIKSPIVITAIKMMTQAFMDMTKLIQDFISGGGIKRMTDQFFNLANVVINYVAPVFELAYNIVKQSVGLLLDFVAAGVQGIYALIGNFGGLISSALKAVGIENSFTTAMDNFKSATDETMSAMDTNLRVRLSSMGENLTDFSATASASTGLDTFKASVDATSEAMGKLKEKSKEEADEIVTTVKDMSKDINTALDQGFVRAVAGSIQHVVTNLVNGQNAFKDFGKMLLNMLGDLSMQVGTMLITAGWGMSSLFTGNPSGMIMWGAALVAIGAALKAFGSKGASAASPSSGPAAQETTMDQMNYTNPVSRDQAPQAGVNITIQGNVMDSQETGLRIVELINQAIDGQSATVRGTA